MEELAEESGPIGVQLFDHRPAAMADAARRAEAAGAFLIDINMGCPVKKIARKGGGSGLIREPDLAARIVDTVARAVSIPVTVKTRLGWCGSDAEPVAWCRQLEQAGAQLLTLHGRTREQGFKGRADWQAIAAVKRALRIPLIANGDIHSPEDALRCLELTGADGVMVGRGTMGAPWLVGQIDAALSGRPVPPTPGAAERIALAREQLLALVAARGDHGLLIARKHMGWTCQGFPGAPQLRHALMRAPTPAEARSCWSAPWPIRAARPRAARSRAAPWASPGGSAAGRSRARRWPPPPGPGPPAPPASPPAGRRGPAPAARAAAAAAAPRPSGGRA